MVEQQAIFEKQIAYADEGDLADGSVERIRQRAQGYLEELTKAFQAVTDSFKMNYKTFTIDDLVNPPTGLSNTNSQLNDLTSTVGLLVQTTSEMQVSKRMPSRGALFSLRYCKSIRYLNRRTNLLEL